MVDEPVDHRPGPVRPTTDDGIEPGVLRVGCQASMPDEGAITIQFCQDGRDLDVPLAMQAQQLPMSIADRRHEPLFLEAARPTPGATPATDSERAGHPCRSRGKRTDEREHREHRLAEHRRDHQRSDQRDGRTDECGSRRHGDDRFRERRDELDRPTLSLFGWPPTNLAMPRVVDDRCDRAATVGQLDVLVTAPPELDPVDSDDQGVTGTQRLPNA